MKKSIPLPIRYPKVYLGNDIVVHESKGVASPNCINIYGHNSIVAIEIKEALTNAYPNHFNPS